MHEVSLVAALVDQIEEVAKRDSFDRVTQIRLKVGALSGVEPSCLEFCFSEVTHGSVLEGAKLVLDFEKIELQCRDCDCLSYPEDPGAIFCERCQSSHVVINKGRDFKVVDLDVL